MKAEDGSRMEEALVGLLLERAEVAKPESPVETSKVRPKLLIVSVAQPKTREGIPRLLKILLLIGQIDLWRAIVFRCLER
jgi:hypothetical protein